MNLSDIWFGTKMVVGVAVFLALLFSGVLFAVSIGFTILAIIYSIFKKDPVYDTSDPTNITRK